MRHAYEIAAFMFVACVLPSHVHAQATARNDAAKSGASPCQVEGVWELVSTTTGGDSVPMGGYRQRKMVHRGHYMWLGADAKRDTITLRTLTDSLRASHTPGGAGTYTLAGNTYTERLTIFFDPAMEGRDFPATCRTEGDRWYHTFPATTSNTSQTPQTVEVWRRIQ